MDKKMKQFYQVPSIKVVSFKVEEGFTASRRDVSIGDETITPAAQGTEGFFVTELSTQ